MEKCCDTVRIRFYCFLDLRDTLRATLKTLIPFLHLRCSWKALGSIVLPQVMCIDLSSELVVDGTPSPGNKKQKIVNAQLFNEVQKTFLDKKDLFIATR